MWYQFVTWALIIQQVIGAGFLEIAFVSYHGNGRDSSGNCCDLFCGNCDPYFKLCVNSRGSSNGMVDCSIVRRQTRHYQNKNTINFGTSVQGMENPLIIPQTVVPINFNVEVAVYDYESFNEDDHIDTLITAVQNLIPTANGIKGNYRHVQLRNSNRATLNIKLRSYCGTSFHGKTCAKQCIPQDNGFGHYTCNTEGEKNCNAGWTGVNCNRCNVCKNGGTCISINNGFTCNCKDGFEGIHCERAKDKCVVEPCMNGGTCLLNNNVPTGFTCRCHSGWVGEVCDKTSVVIPLTSTDRSINGNRVGGLYNITLMATTDRENLNELEDGLSRLIKDLGGVRENVKVKVLEQIIRNEDGVKTIYVKFASATDNGDIDSRILDDIFKRHRDAKVNSYLPFPIYRRVHTRAETDEAQDDWLRRNLYVVVLPIVAVLILVILLVVFLVCYRRKRKRQVIRKYKGKHQYDDIKDGTPVTMRLTSQERNGVCAVHSTSTCADESHPYTEIRHYDLPERPVLCTCNGVIRYKNSNLVTPDPWCDGGLGSEYNDIRNLDETQDKVDTHEYWDETQDKVDTHEYWDGAANNNGTHEYWDGKQDKNDTQEYWDDTQDNEHIYQEIT